MIAAVLKVTTVTVECDHKGCSARTSTEAEDPEGARETLAHEGWTTLPDGSDRCPQHSPAQPGEMTALAMSAGRAWGAMSPIDRTTIRELSSGLAADLNDMRALVVRAEAHGWADG